MPTSVTQVQQYVRGLVKGRPLGIVSVTEFGAVGDGTADDTAAIQAAINAAQAAFDAGTVTVSNRISQAPAVYFPEGTYKTTNTLTIARQLRLFGTGYLTSIIAGTANAPIFDVNVTSQREYTAATFEHLAICGNSGSTAGKESQHGIRIKYTASGLDATLDVRFCAIEFCGGHGIYFQDNANTPRILGNIIQTNWLDGINFCGGGTFTPSFATNARILHNIIRENRRGVVYDGTTAASNGAGATTYLYSGHIAYNLVEGNTNGSGQVGSSTRPAQGVVLLNTREIIVESNYFEQQLQHVHVGVAGFLASAYCQIARNQFYGVSVVPGRFPGFNGPAQKPCDVALASGSLVGIVCRDNLHEIPQRPTGTSVTDWSNGAWPDTLPVFPIIDGQQHVIAETIGNGGSIDNTDTPFFREWRQLGTTSEGLTRGVGAGMILSPVDGTFPANEFIELAGQVAPYDAAGKSALRFTRRADGGGFLSVYANDSTGTLRHCAHFLGQEQGIQPGAGGVRDNANGAQVLGNRKTGWALPTGTSSRASFDTATVSTAQLAQRVKALIEDLHPPPTGNHGLIGS